jgi:hypothetical protein
MNKSILILAVLIAGVFVSCKKDDFITSPAALLSVSTDSIRFDTVFTTVGSVTQSFKIRNNNEQPIRLSEVKLMGGSSSAFSININGIPGPEVFNVELAAQDSMYVFVSVRVDPGAGNLPFIISDSISIKYNGNQRWVQLEAYGQNARFMNGQTISSNTTWDNTLPYVILDYVDVAPGVILSIQPGTRIYAHANAPLIVEGSLNAIGTATTPIIFTGDRLDAPYNSFPASWPGIIFSETSINNQLKFARINNAYQAIVVDQPASNANAKLTIDQCIIDNAFNAGIFAINSSINASNLLISNCANNIALQGGGSYSMIHCTAASFSNNFLLHKSPVLSVSNYSLQNGIPVSNNLQAAFTNCIFWGDNGFVENEIVVGKEGSLPFNVVIANSLYRANTDPGNTTLSNVIRNQDPLFDSIDISNRYFDFRHTKVNGPGVNAGIASSINKDLDNQNRPVGLPDLGCYEKQ